MTEVNRSAAEAAEAAAASEVPEYTHRQVMTILSGLLLGMFLAALDQSIVATAVRTIADDLQGLSVQAWATTAYLVTSVVTTPIYGKLGDLYGRKRLFMIAITIFVIGSAACSFATSMYNLAALRALQGLGAGGLFTLVLAIIGDIVSPRERAKYTGYFMAVFATSSVLGPVAGGLFAGQESILGIAGWRWVFLVNVPIGALALLVVARNLRLHHRPRRARIDWLGALLLVVAVVPLLVVAEQGRHWGWASVPALVSYALVVGGTLAFVVTEQRLGDDALLPLRILRMRATAVVLTGGVLVGAAMFGSLTVLPQYLQIVHGASPTAAGLMMVPMVGGMMVAGILTGQVTSRTGRIRPFPIIGSGMGAVAMFVLSYVDENTPLTWLMLGMAFLGLGLGQCMQPLTIIVQNAAPPEDIGVATSSSTFFRQLGGTLGVAIFLSLLFGTLGTNIDTAFDDQRGPVARAVAAGQVPATEVDAEVLAAVADPEANDVFERVQDDSSLIDQMSPVIAQPFRTGFADSMSLVLAGSAGVLVIAFGILLLLPAVELRTSRSGAAGRAEQEAMRE